MFYQPFESLYNWKSLTYLYNLLAIWTKGIQKWQITVWNRNKKAFYSRNLELEKDWIAFAKISNYSSETRQGFKPIYIVWGKGEYRTLSKKGLLMYAAFLWTNIWKDLRAKIQLFQQIDVFLITTNFENADSAVDMLYSWGV